MLMLTVTAAMERIKVDDASLYGSFDRSADRRSLAVVVVVTESIIFVCYSMMCCGTM